MHNYLPDCCYWNSELCCCIGNQHGVCCDCLSDSWIVNSFDDEVNNCETDVCDRNFVNGFASVSLFLHDDSLVPQSISMKISIKFWANFRKSLTRPTATSATMRTWTERWWFWWLINVGLFSTTEVSKFIEHRWSNWRWMWWQLGLLTTFVLGSLIRSRSMRWRCTVLILLWNIHWIFLFFILIWKCIFRDWSLFFAVEWKIFD